MHRAFKIASDFDEEVQTITLKYLEVGYPIGYIKSVINDFKNSKKEKQLIIPEWLFDQRKKVLFKLPSRLSNERDVKRFIDKIESFTYGKLKFSFMVYQKHKIFVSIKRLSQTFVLCYL